MINNLYLSQLAHNTAYGRTLEHTEREESSKAAKNKEHSTSKSIGSSQSKHFMPTFIQEDKPMQKEPVKDNEDVEILAKYQALGEDFQSALF